ncbi:MAG: UbiD family decarboxylase [Dehalococcoidia bacterium]|jgi:4-hydroxy-3-polyprenylbenzoate decarboxylase|nr:UbiD family decarboxylase [Dehalococcoidia bacterium]
MAFTDLQSFLAYLEANGELHRISAPVSPELEITEIATRSVLEGGPALLFENVEGSSYPVAINVLSSRRRVNMAIGGEPEELGERLLHFMRDMNPPSFKAIWRNRGMAKRFMNFRPGKSRKAPVQEVVESNPDLGTMPILKCWPGDGGRFVTLPLVHTVDQVTGIRNIGMYRMQVYDGQTTGMHIQIERGGGVHHWQAEGRGRPLEVAVAIGGDPALWLATVAALPEGFDEAAFAGFLRNARTPMTRAATLDMQVPAQAEFVLEGVVPPNVRRVEGPFGDHFGHYSEPAEFPIFQVIAITRRRNPVYPATVVGRPPQEDKFIGDATQEVLKPLAKLIHPELTDLWAYFEAGFHNLLVVSVETRYEREPLKTALGLLGTGQLALCKVIVLVDPDVNVRSFARVVGAIRRNFDVQRDVQVIARAPVDTLDFTGGATTPVGGGKLIIDATGRGASPDTAVPLPGDLAAIAPGVMRSRFIEQTLLVVQVENEPRRALEALVASPLLSPVKLIAVVSPDIDIDDDTSVLWGLFTRFDPAQDIVFTGAELRGPVPAYSGVMGIDASLKSTYPRPLVMDPGVIQKVDRRWGEYFS